MSIDDSALDGERAHILEAFPFARTLISFVVAMNRENRDARAYREKMGDSETVSMWQNLAFGPNYKAAYCMAVCPAGEQVNGAYANDKKNFLRAFSVDNFLGALRHLFQRNRSAGLDAVYHFTFTFTFTGAERRQATVVIADRKLTVREDLAGKADRAVTADSETWIRFLRKEAGLPWALVSRRIRLRGDPRRLLAFGKCFPA